METSVGIVAVVAVVISLVAEDVGVFEVEGVWNSVETPVVSASILVNVMKLLLATAVVEIVDGCIVDVVLSVILLVIGPSVTSVLWVVVEVVVLCSSVDGTVLECGDVIVVTFVVVVIASGVADVTSVKMKSKTNLQGNSLIQYEKSMKLKRQIQTYYISLM